MIRVNDRVSVKFKVESGLGLRKCLNFNDLGLGLSLRVCLGLHLHCTQRRFQVLSLPSSLAVTRGILVSFFSSAY